VVWLVFMSWYANLVGYIAAFVAAKAETAAEANGSVIGSA
jgi:hypothetical protein